MEAPAPYVDPKPRLSPQEEAVQAAADKADRALQGYSKRRALYLVRQDASGIVGPYLKDAVVSCATRENAVLKVREAIRTGGYLNIRGYYIRVPEVVALDPDRLSVDQIGLAGEVLPGIVTMAFLVGVAAE